MHVNYTLTKQEYSIMQQPVLYRMFPRPYCTIRPNWSPCPIFPQPHRILQALRRYVRAENKDRQHTIRHYQHVLAVDPEKAAQMKSQVSRFVPDNHH